MSFKSKNAYVNEFNRYNTILMKLKAFFTYIIFIARNMGFHYSTKDHNILFILHLHTKDTKYRLYLASKCVGTNNNKLLTLM